MKNGFQGLMVNQGINILEAMKIMDESSRKILFVINDSQKLIGTITDGDIRRWILKGGDLSKEIVDTYNKTPLTFNDDYKISEVKKVMVERGIQSIPIINKKGQIKEILFWEEVFAEKFMENNVKVDIPVVIMAGGRGARLDPFTRILPKPLIPVGDKPILEIIIDNFQKYSVDNFYITLNYKGEMIKSYFDNTKKDYDMNYIWEMKPLGTAGGLKLLPEFESEDFFLSNCDVIINSEYDSILEFHKKNDFDITIVASMQSFKVPYGVLAINNGGSLMDIKEKPEYSFLVNTGMYAMKTSVIKEIPENTVFDMTDLISKLKEKEYKIGVYPISQRSWLDIGQWEEYNDTVKKLSVGY
jgi:dTDP-glucose pyrophosphorylase